MYFDFCISPQIKEEFRGSKIPSNSGDKRKGAYFFYKRKPYFFCKRKPCSFAKENLISSQKKTCFLQDWSKGLTFSSNKVSGIKRKKAEEGRRARKRVEGDGEVRKRAEKDGRRQNAAEESERGQKRAEEGGKSGRGWKRVKDGPGLVMVSSTLLYRF